MGTVVAFTLTAMANPTLIAVTTLMLLLPDPNRLMLGYLAGAFLTSITLGLVPRVSTDPGDAQGATSFDDDERNGISTEAGASRDGR